MSLDFLKNHIKYFIAICFFSWAFVLTSFAQKMDTITVFVKNNTCTKPEINASVYIYTEGEYIGSSTNKDGKCILFVNRTLSDTLPITISALFGQPQHLYLVKDKHTHYYEIGVCAIYLTDEQLKKIRLNKKSRKKKLKK